MITQQQAIHRLAGWVYDHRREVSYEQNMCEAEAQARILYAKMLNEAAAHSPSCLTWRRYDAVAAGAVLQVHAVIELLGQPEIGVPKPIEPDVKP